MRTARMASAASFAHLLGRRPGAVVPAPAPAQAAVAETEDDTDETAETEDTDAAAETEENDDETTESEDDDEEEEKKKEAKAEARGRKAERKRCAAIFGHQAAGTRPDLAAHLAFETSLSIAAATSLLAAAAAGKPRGGLADRMSTVAAAPVGPDAASGKPGAQGLAAQIIAAGKKRRGEPD